MNLQRTALLITALLYAESHAVAANHELSIPSALEEVTVYARKQAEDLSTVPLTISALNKAELQLFQVENLNELERLTPNMVFDSTSPISGSTQSAAVFVRGVGQAEFLLTNDPGVGIYVDGVYMARTLGAVLDTAAIEQIEVIKGPQGTLFGKNTIGGAINIITATPGDHLNGSIHTRLGSDNRRDVSLHIDAPISPELLTSWSFSSREIDGYTNRLLTGEEQGDENKQSFFTKWLWRVSNDLSITVSIDGQDVDESGAPNILVADSAAAADANIRNSALSSTYNVVVGQNIILPNGQDGQVDSRYLTFDSDKSNATGPNYSELDTLGGQITADWLLSEIALKSITAYRDLNSRFGRDPDGSPITAVHTQNDIDHHQYSQEFQVTGKVLNERLNWIAGLYYFHETGRDNIIADIYPSLFIPVTIPLSVSGYYDVEQSSYAAYGQLNYKLAEQWRLNIGIRYTDEEKEFTSNQVLTDINILLVPNNTFTSSIDEITPSMGVDYQWTDSAMLYASYSEGFKSGGYVARYVVPAAAPKIFEPEYVDNYELGLKISAPDRRWQLNAATFYADYTDIQLLVLEGSVPFTENAAKGRVRGIEADFKYRLNDQWLISGMLGYLDAEFTDVEANASVTEASAFVNAPEWSTQVAVDYQVMLNNGDTFQFSSDYSWRSEVANDAVNTPVLEEDDLGLWSARLSYQLAASDWEFSLYGKNLSDKAYVISGASDIPAFGVTEANYSRGREMGIAINYQFNPQ
jgi:iron complex outermembrane receptor protein